MTNKVCITHGRFYPCTLRRASCVISNDPRNVTKVQMYQDGDLDMPEWDAVRDRRKQE